MAGASPEELIRRDARRVWHPYAAAPVSPPPVPVVSAGGVRLHLADGRSVIDGMSSWWAAIHGYGHPTLDAAVRAQLDDMAHVMFGGLTHAPGVELCETLAELTGLDRVFLADSGSVAVEVALKMALQYWHGVGRPDRNRFMTVRGGYHGDTLGAMAVCDPVTGMHRLFTSVLPSAVFAPVPQPPYGADWDPAAADRFVALLDENEHQIAAVILEPVVQGAGGMRFYHPEFLRTVRTACERHETLLIADEVATGFGRTGRLFGCDHAGIRPDIMCLGKAMTGGYLSMAATLCTDEVAAGVGRAESGALMHGPTFMANPLAAAVSRASIELLADGDWEDHVATIERHLDEGLAPARELEAVADVRVLGAIGVIEARADWAVGPTQEALLSQGVWLRPFGRLLYTMPPYVTPADDVTSITDAMVAVARRL